MSSREMWPEKVVQKLANLPDSPGCYQMMDGNGRVIYVGKARVLRNRVRSYFHHSAQHGPKTLALVQEIQDILWWVTGTELEALVLENELIKRFKPHYNIRLKDDKSFPYIKVNVQNDFPKIQVVRRMLKDGARYFGPYSSGRVCYDTLDALRRIFPYLDCDREITGNDPRPCLYFHIKMCGGPCIGAQSRDEYRATIEQLMDFLHGDTDEVLKRLNGQMARAAENMQFELAALYRDRLKAANQIAEQQKVVSTQQEDVDYVAIARDERTGDTAVQVFYVRRGRLTGRETFMLEGIELGNEATASGVADSEVESEEPSESLISESGVSHTGLNGAMTGAQRYDSPEEGDVQEGLISDALATDLLNGSQPAASRLEPSLAAAADPALANTPAPNLAGALTGAFIQQFYDNATFVPNLLLVQALPDDVRVLEEWLAGKRGAAVEVRVPRRGDKRKLMEMAQRNAAEHLRVQQVEWAQDTNRQTAAVAELQEVLGMQKPPARIECYDISTLQGTNTVGSMVVFAKGAPLKSAYKRFKIRGKGSQGEPDDFASMREMLRRRFRRVIEDDHDEEDPGKKARQGDENWKIVPDLVIIDGGKGQLGIAVEVLEEFGLTDRIPVVGLAKREEEIYRPHLSNPIWLKRGSAALHLVQRVRDETHRFGVTYHRNLRGKEQVRSRLDDVPGIGPSKRKALLAAFGGDIEAIRSASIEQLAAVPGINRRVAETIKQHL